MHAARDGPSTTQSPSGPGAAVLDPRTDRQVTDPDLFVRARRHGGPPMVGALLRMPVDAVHQGMFERLHERGFTDIDPAHLIVFQWPGPDDTRPSELAARLQISKQALNYLLGQLEQLGYLERRRDPHDQRGKRIAVTERGRAAIRVIREAVDEIEAAWAKQLGAERFAQLKTHLLSLNQLTATREPAIREELFP